MTKQEWGDLFGVLAGVLSCGPALVAGCITALDGKGMDAGMEAVLNGAYKAGESFGKEYGKTVAKTTVKLATGVVLGQIGHGIVDGIRKD